MYSFLQILNSMDLLMSNDSGGLPTSLQKVEERLTAMLTRLATTSSRGDLTTARGNIATARGGMTAREKPQVLLKSSGSGMACSVSLPKLTELRPRPGAVRVPSRSMQHKEDIEELHKHPAGDTDSAKFDAKVRSFMKNRPRLQQRRTGRPDILLRRRSGSMGSITIQSSEVVKKDSTLIFNRRGFVSPSGNGGKPRVAVCPRDLHSKKDIEGSEGRKRETRGANSSPKRRGAQAKGHSRKRTNRKGSKN